MPEVSTKNRVAIEVDRALCYGFGDCVDTVPAVFALDEEDTAIVLDPDAAPDTDFAGYNFWLGKLDEFNGDFVSAEMVKAFISSTEYRRRFGQ